MVKPAKESFRFADLLALRDQIAEMPPLEQYRARDGAALSFRRYPATSSRHLILVHGSSGHSAYLHAFARYLSARNIANVHAPDLRGHGPSPQRRGDIDYVSQLEDDLADLVAHVAKTATTDARFLIGGHSSGGGLALRFSGCRHRALVRGVILLAPYLGHAAPMVKGRAGGWARANVPRIIGISALDALGVRRFNGAKVLRFNLPLQYRSGHETLEYSFRLMKGMHPADYRAALQATSVPLLILVGSEDEAFHAEGFKSGVAPYKPDAMIRFVRGGTHLGILMSEDAMAEAGRWMQLQTFS